MDNTTLSIIKALTPFDTMTEHQFNALMAEGNVSQKARGTLIFKRSTSDDYLYWLIEGSINLLDANFNTSVCRAGDTLASRAIDDSSPHQVSAVCEEDSLILTVNKTDLANILENREESDSIDETKDWMSALLSTPLFEFIPPKNIQALFKAFESVHLQKGEIIIRQNDPGDYFYAIRSGRVKVELEKEGASILIANLGIGDTFGQDALVSDDLRNATVTTLSACTLMRLAEPEFEKLLLEPVIEYVTETDLEDMSKLADAKPVIIDLRSLENTNQSKYPGSINIPLLLLRKNLKQLSIDNIFIMVGERKPKIAELGAYLMNERGFTAYVLASD
jgi:CRP-like cAMP-binding protein